VAPLTHPSADRSRRRLLAAGAAALTAAALSGCGSGTSGAPAASGHERTDDLEILNGALDIEHLSIAAYGEALPRLGGADAALARRLLEQERAHADALSTLIGELGATPTPPATPRPLRPLRGRSDALSFLGGIENTAIAFYVDALPKLSGPFRHVALGIVASEAEHLAVLRVALGLPAAPAAFVWGHP
jgi:rubrerythrin